MPTNQYDKSFAGGVGANTLTPAAWAALTTLLSQGFQPGIALSEQVNTVLRQVTTFMGGVSRWVDSVGGVDQLDDGNPVNYAAAFTAAMNNLYRIGLARSAPVGAIEMYAGVAVPTGWLLCNGAAVSRATYFRLYEAIGGAYGIGDGSTTFNLPDFRGVFPRGHDAGRGIDLSRVLGTTQADAIKSHIHYNGVGDGGAAPASIYGSVTAGAPGAATQSIDTSTPAPSRQGNTSGNVDAAAETRPVNLSVNFIIRHHAEY